MVLLKSDIAALKISDISRILNSSQLRDLLTSAEIKYCQTINTEQQQKQQNPTPAVTCELVNVSGAIVTE